MDELEPGEAVADDGGAAAGAVESVWARANREFAHEVMSDVRNDRRAQAAALDCLAELRKEAESLEALTRAWVGSARLVGTTWREIGVALGVSQQAVSKRFGSVEVPREVP